jgi:hypothetical protein
MIDYPSEDQAEQIIKVLIERYPNVLSRLKEFEDREDLPGGGSWWTWPVRPDYKPMCYRFWFKDFPNPKVASILDKYSITGDFVTSQKKYWATRSLFISFDAAKDIEDELKLEDDTVRLQGWYK